MEADLIDLRPFFFPNIGDAVNFSLKYCFRGIPQCLICCVFILI